MTLERGSGFERPAIDKTLKTFFPGKPVSRPGGGLRTVVRAAAMCAVGAMLTTGCDSAKKEEKKLDFKAALNSYYGGRPRCLWNHTVMFPDHASASNEAEYKSLTDAGLLAYNKKTKIYDLSEKGKAAWDADVLDKGYGNFCYGHRKVTSIDGSRRLNPTTMQVKFHYDLLDRAAWVSEPAVGETFPAVNADLAGPQTAQAAVLDTQSGWEVQKVEPLTEPPAKPKFLSRFRRKKK